MLWEKIPQGINTTNLNKDRTIHIWIKTRQAANFRFLVSTVCKLNFFFMFLYALSIFCILAIQAMSLLYTWYKLELFVQKICHKEDSWNIRINYEPLHHKKDLFMPLPNLLICLYLEFTHQDGFITKVGYDVSFSSVLVYK